MSIRRRSERGVIAVLVAILTSVLFLSAALVVDMGHARDVKRQVENTADASALAAGNTLWLNPATPAFTNAVTAAKTYATQNLPTETLNWTTCTDSAKLSYVPAGSTPCVSFDSSTQPTEVRVKLPDAHVQASLARLVGVSQTTLTASSDIRLTPGGMGECGLCVIGSGSHTIQNGNIAANVNVAMNGTVAGQPNGGITVTGGTLSVAGGNTTGKGTFTPTITTGKTITDPLASMTMPTWSSVSNKGSVNPCTGGPGRYPNFDKASSCTLSPGLYVVTGATKLSGQHDIRGTGVTLYFTCGTSAAPVACTSATSWNFDMNSQNTFLNLTAPTTSPVNGAMAGMAIVADRAWTGTLSFQGGGGGGTTTGSIYLKAGKLGYGGNTQAKSLDSLIVVGDLDMNGNPAYFGVTYTAAANVKVSATGLHLCYKATSSSPCN